MKINILVLIGICLCITLFGQQLREVGYTQLADDIFFSNKDSVIYENVHFKNDLPNLGRESFMSDYLIGAPQIIKGGFKNYLTIKNATKDTLGRFVSQCSSIRIRNCVFDDDLRLSNVNISGELSIQDASFPNPTTDDAPFIGEQVGGALLIDSTSISRLHLFNPKKYTYRFHLKLNHSDLNYLAIFVPNAQLEIINSVLRNYVTISIDYSSLIRVDSLSLLTNDTDTTLSFYDPYNFTLNVPNGKEFSFNNSTLKDTTAIFSIFEVGSDLIQFSNNKFDSNIDFSFRNDAQLLLTGNVYSKKLTIDFDAISRRSFIDTQSVNGFNFGFLTGGNEYYDASRKEHLSYEFSYANYLRVNKTMYDFYRETGNLKSANASYVRIKDIEYTHDRLLYDSIPTFSRMFSINLNRLLKFYTNYGTDPAKALVISFYILLSFAFFYFFFPSDWDKTSKTTLLQNYKDFIEKNEKGYFKPFLKLTWGFLISLFNAMTLSLNAFTTLGFGNIPTHGVARYICVLQGFLGWFLLSLFTVALINQAQF